MARNIELSDAMALVELQMKAFTPTGRVRLDLGKEMATLEVSRGAIHGSVILSFHVSVLDGPVGPRMEPVVRVSIPAFNDGVLKAVALSALFTELTAFGVVLQMMLDDLRIAAPSRKS